jgi:hypothetical protein
MVRCRLHGVLHAKSNPCSGNAAQRIAGYAEEDAFFVFTNLMAEFRDLYCVAADNSNFGINVRSETNVRCSL